MHFLEEDLKILESIALQHAAGTKEYGTLKRAGIALLYVSLEGDARFKSIWTIPRRLTAEQRADLAKWDHIRTAI
jgi:hypothetical protein